jgi:hypothetical protein
VDEPIERRKWLVVRCTVDHTDSFESTDCWNASQQQALRNFFGCGSEVALGDNIQANCVRAMFGRFLVRETSDFCHSGAWSGQKRWKLARDRYSVRHDNKRSSDFAGGSSSLCGGVRIVTIRVFPYLTTECQQLQEGLGKLHRVTRGG